MKNGIKITSFLAIFSMVFSIVLGSVGTALAAESEMNAEGAGAVSATFSPVNSSGIHGNKVYEAFKLTKNGEDISLASDNVSSISVTKPDGSAETLETDTDPLLWFNVQNESGPYTYTIVNKDASTTYRATLDWAGADTVTATMTDHKGEHDGKTYVGYQLGNLDISVADAVYAIDASGASELTVLHDADPLLWLNVEKPVGDYTYLVKQGSNWSQSTITVSAPIISDVKIESSNENKMYAKVGDTVTLTFNTNEKVFQLTAFNFNGSKPKTFDSVQGDGKWVNTATYIVDETDPEGLMHFQINVENFMEQYSITTEATSDGSSVTVLKTKPEISEVSIASNNADDTTKAKVGDTVTLRFVSNQEVFKQSSFNINGNKSITFNSQKTGDSWTTEASYVIEDSDKAGKMFFQINVKNGVGIFSETVENTTDTSEVIIVRAPEILDVSIRSNNADTTKAKVGDIVTLTFKTTRQVWALSSFNFNGSKPVSFTSTRLGDTWNNVATYKIDSSDPEGKVAFQINVQDSDGNYSVTTESTSDGSSVTVDNGIANPTVTLSQAISTTNFGNSETLNAFMSALWGGVDGTDESAVVDGITVNRVISVEGSTLTVDADKVTDGMKQFIKTNYGGSSVPVKINFSESTPKEMTTDPNWDNAYLVWVDLDNVVSKDYTIAMKNGTISSYSVQEKVADLTAYNAALAAVNEDDYTTESWSDYQAIVAANVVTVDNTQQEVDTATANIVAAQKDLVRKPAPPVEGDQVSSIQSNNVLLVGDYAFELNNLSSGYNLNNFLVAAQTAYLTDGTYHIYFKINGKWYDLVSDPQLKQEVDVTTINGDGLFQYFNMQKQ